MPIPPDHEPHGMRQTKKAAASGWIGSALEYYDFFIYATAASLIFPQIFLFALPAPGTPSLHHSTTPAPLPLRAAAPRPMMWRKLPHST